MIRRTLRLEDEDKQSYLTSGEDHICSVCGKIGSWTQEWSWYGSYKDLDDGISVLKFCSQECRTQGVH